MLVKERQKKGIMGHEGGVMGHVLKCCCYPLTSAPPLSAITSQIISISASFMYASHAHVV